MLLIGRKISLIYRSFENCYLLKNDDYDIVVNLSYLFAKTQDYKKSLLFSNRSINLIMIDQKHTKIWQSAILILKILMKLKKIY